MAYTEAQKRAIKKWRERHPEKVLASNRKQYHAQRRKRYDKVAEDIVELGGDKEKILDYITKNLQIKGGRQWDK